jgi:hypothetical protein
MIDSQNSQHRNFFSRFWRGGYSLPFSYWVISFLGNIVVSALLVALMGAFGSAEFNPYLTALYICLVWLLVLAWGIFNIVGVWRSATRYREEKVKQNKSAGWALLAQVALLASAFNLASEFIKSGVPQLQESWNLAFENDRSIPDYTLRVMRNGTELEIAGGLKYGLASDVEKIIRASPQIKTIHLNSIGGRLGEAQKLGALIRSRGLITYTSSECLSACTIAFAAGAERWIKNNAKLGYHAGSFAGKDSSEGMRDALLQAGLNASFVARAISYTQTQMWYPTKSELLAARAISGTVDSYRFAVSGYGIRPGMEDFANELRKVSIFRAIEEIEPDTFAAIAREFQQRYIDGLPEGTIIDALRDSRMVPLIRSRLPKADDKTLVEYSNLIAEEYEVLGARDSRVCFEYAVKGGSTKALELFGPELRNRELALSEQVLRSTKTRTALTEAQQEVVYRKVFAKLAARYADADVRLLIEPEKVKPAQYAAYCRVSASMFREIGRLPLVEAGGVLSEFFKEANSPNKK